MEALAMMGLPFYVMFALTLLIIVLACFIRKCKQWCRFERNVVLVGHISWVKTTAIAAILLVAASMCIVWSFYANDQVTDSVTKVSKTLKWLSSDRDEHITDATGVASDLTHVLELSNSIETKLAVLDVCSNTTDFSIILKNVQSVIELVEKSKHAITNTTVELEDYSFNSLNTHLEDYNEWRSTGSLVVLSILCLPFVLMVVSFPFRVLIIVRNVAWIGSVISCLAWILVGLGSGASVGLGDLCAEPDAFVQSQVDDSAVAFAYVTAYIECTGIPSNNTNPLYLVLDETDTAITSTANQMDATIAFLESAKQNTTGCDNPSELIASAIAKATQLNQFLKSDGNPHVTAAMDSLECLTIHNMYVDSLKSFCGKGLTFICSITFCELVLAVLCCIGIFIAKKVEALVDPRPRVTNRRNTAARQIEHNSYTPFKMEATETLLEELSLENMERRYGQKPQKK
eukprot:c7669_g1_i1.p1 GENE.c7669_g1_i1~~c7669_g1_i1.p1  ORF type:complete len:507 (+),score=125.14 c7669_g1_i1:146-1522(+)